MDMLVFLASVFEVPKEGMLENGVPSMAFLEREEEFNIIPVTYTELDGAHYDTKTAIICARSTDEAYIERWGEARFHEHCTSYGIETIWNWKEDSGLRPCAVYLRHCYLAAKNMGGDCLSSFLDDTMLVDRMTTVRQYLEQFPEVLLAEPPTGLLSRYSG